MTDKGQSDLFPITLGKTMGMERDCLIEWFGKVYAVKQGDTLDWTGEELRINGLVAKPVEKQ